MRSRQQRLPINRYYIIPVGACTCLLEPIYKTRLGNHYNGMSSLASIMAHLRVKEHHEGTRGYYNIGILQQIVIARPLATGLSKASINENLALIH